MKNKGLSYMKNMILLALGVMLMLVGCGMKSSPENVAIKACETTLNDDMDAYYELLAPPYQEYMVGSDGWFESVDEFQDELSDWSEDHREDIAYKCGSDFKFDCKAAAVKECDEEDLEKIKNELTDFGYKKKEIRDAAVVTVSISASGDEGKGTWTAEEACVKIGNSWYLHRPGFDTF